MPQISVKKAIIAQLVQLQGLLKYVHLQLTVTFQELEKSEIAVSVRQVTTAQSNQWSPSSVQWATTAPSVL